MTLDKAPHESSAPATQLRLASVLGQPVPTESTVSPVLPGYAELTHVSTSSEPPTGKLDRSMRYTFQEPAYMVAYPTQAGAAPLKGATMFAATGPAKFTRPPGRERMPGKPGQNCVGAEDGVGPGVREPDSVMLGVPLEEGVPVGVPLEEPVPVWLGEAVLEGVSPSESVAVGENVDVCVEVSTGVTVRAGDSENEGVPVCEDDAVCEAVCEGEAVCVGVCV